MANEIRQFNRFIRAALPGCTPFDFADKDRAIDQHVSYMLDRTQSMFKWSGLPDSIPQRILELYLQINGNVCFYRYDGTLYVFTGGLGGEPDVYYRPTLYTIANPALKWSASLCIDEECVVMPNDSLYLGLLPLYARYATMMTETELSMLLALVNTRTTALISASDDRTMLSAQKYLKDLRDGKQGIVGETPVLDGVKVQPYAVSGGSNYLTNLIEFMQYTKASWFNELGLNANYNMKRESINSGESQLNDDALLPLVDDMLNCRRLAAEKVNAMFGTSISVDFASSWQDNQQEIDAEQAVITDEDEPEKEDTGEGGDTDV